MDAVYESDDSIAINAPPEERAEDIYEKGFALTARASTLDLVVREENSRRIGTMTQPIPSPETNP